MIHNKYFEIMKQFLKGYDREIYGRELIGKVKISQKNIALTLNKLEEEGVVSSKIRGNIKHYFLNKQNPLIKRYLLLTEVEKTLEFLKENLKINEIADKIKKGKNIICIFGSYAKGIQKKDSDLDLFVAGNIDEENIKEIGKDYNIEINIKRGSKFGFVKLLKENNPLMNEILENHIIVSGYEEFVEEVVKQKW